MADGLYGQNYIVSKLQRKRYVLRFFLKIAVDWEDFMYSGNLFHTSGAALEKDLSPNVFKFLRGTSRRLFCEERRDL